MKFLRLVCCFWLLAASGFGLDREAFTFTRYDLNARVDPGQHRFEARGAVSVRNDSPAAQKNLSLQISSSLSWRSIRIAGRPVQFVSQTYSSDIDHSGALSEAIVTLPAEVPPGGMVQLEVGYEGVIVLDATRLTRIGVPEETALHSDWDQIGSTFTAVRGVGYVAWYPVATNSASLSEGNSVFDAIGRWKSREADTELKVAIALVQPTSEETPETLSAAKIFWLGATGFGSQSSQTSYVFSPLGLTAPGFVVAPFNELDSSGLTINYLPGHKAVAEAFALSVEKALPLVTEWFGARKQPARVVELYDSRAGSFESGETLLVPLAGVDSQGLKLDATHQLVHSAFPSPRPWIYEGLAHFAQALDREHLTGRKAAVDYMALQRSLVADAEKSAAPVGDRISDNSLIKTSNEDLYRAKSMLVWWMLRDLIGETALKGALANYRPEADKDPAYTERLIQQQTHRDIKWFFEDWVYNDRGLPDFRVDSVFNKETSPGNSIVTVTIENRGNAGAEVPVVLRIEGGEVSQRLEIRARSKTTFRFTAASKPLEVVVNDGSVPESDDTNNSYKIEAPAK